MAPGVELLRRLIRRGLESAVRPHAASAACEHFLKKCGRMKKSAASAAKITEKIVHFSYYRGVFASNDNFFKV